MSLPELRRGGWCGARHHHFGSVGIQALVASRIYGDMFFGWPNRVLRLNPVVGVAMIGAIRHCRKSWVGHRALSLGVSHNSWFMQR